MTSPIPRQRKDRPMDETIQTYAEMRRDNLRLRALELALKHNSEGAERVVATAKAYLAFLTDEE